MTPITMVEGLRKLDPVSERNLAERRFSALASAIREHEASVRLDFPRLGTVVRSAEIRLVTG